MTGYVIFFFLWYLITVVSGIRYANGASGLFSIYGRIIDNAFGLLGPKEIPAGNQKPPYKNAIWYNCDKAIKNPLFSNQNNSIDPIPNTDSDSSTVVSGVGPGSFISNKGQAVSSTQYVTQLLTGSNSGNPVDASKYNKKLFKKGTPYYNRSTNGTQDTGYYSWTDKNGNQVPIFDPIPTDNNYDNPYSLSTGQYGEVDPTSGLPYGWEAAVPVTIGGGFKQSVTAVPPVLGNSNGLILFDQKSNNSAASQWPIPNVSESEGNVKNVNSMDFIANTQFLNTQNVSYNKFVLTPDPSDVKKLFVR